MRDDEVEAARSRQHHFERRSRAALRGVHLPSTEELLLGMPFMARDVTRDIHAFAERLLPRMERKPQRFGEIIRRLREATVAPGFEEVVALEAALLAAGDHLKDFGRDHLLRCRIYRAHLGDTSAAIALACDCAASAEARHIVTAGEARSLVTRALGWLCAAARDKDFHPRLLPTRNEAFLEKVIGNH